jgi:hypothetical protein
MTDSEEPDAPRKKPWIPVGCLISLGTLAAVFFFIITICSRH